MLESTPDQASRWLERATAFALAIVCLAGIIFAVLLAMPAFDPIDPKLTSETYLVPLTSFLPESRERVQYVLGCVTFPPLLLLMYVGLRGRLHAHAAGGPIFRLAPWLALVGLGGLGLWMLANGAQEDIGFFFKHTLLVQHPLWVLAIWLVCTWLALRPPRIPPPFARLVNGLPVILVACILLLLFSHNLIGLKNLNPFWSMAIHFSAVFNPVVHVFNGKAILIDFINQYGLYPHLLEPLFRLTGLSVGSFSLTMALLLVASYGSLYAVLRRFTTHQGMTFLGFATLLYYGYYYVKFLNPEDLYYQYHPIRLLFPCLLIGAAATFFRNPGKRRLYVPFTALASLAVLWNLDTGLVVFLTWLLTLGYWELLSADLKTGVRSTLGHVAVCTLLLALTVGAFCAYMGIRYGTWPQLASFLAYQRYFYISGFAMLPLPLAHPWIGAMLIYAIGLLITLCPLVERDTPPEQRPRLALTFLLSILGVGLFSYYQGRSHNYVLTAVWYPAIMLVTLWADRLLSYIRQAHCSGGRAIGASILLAAIVLAFSSSLVSLAAGAPAMAQLARTRFEERAASTRPITENLDLVMAHRNPGESLLALSYNSGAYYLATGTAPDLKVAGLSETILRRDYRDIELRLQRQAFDWVLLDRGLFFYNTAINQDLFRTLVRHYVPAVRSANGEVALLKRRAADDPYPEAASWMLGSKGAAVQASLDMHNAVYHLQDGTRAFLDDKLQVPPVEFGDAFSIQLIAKPKAEQVPHACLVSTHPGYRNFEGFALQKNGGTYAFGFGDGTRWLPSIEVPLPDDQWSFISLVIEGPLVRLYRNGTKVRAFDAGGRMKNSAMPLIIGNWINGDRPFRGGLSEVQIFKRALSEEEIASDWDRVRRRMATRKAHNELLQKF